jgi:hypothetical protein
MATHATPVFSQHSMKSHLSRPPQRPTPSTEPACSWTFLHTYPHGVLRYYENDMILKITSDAAYLVQPKARSRAAAHYHLGWRNSNRTNGPVDILCKTIKNVVSSAAEAATRSIYMGGNTHAQCEQLLKKKLATLNPLLDPLSRPTTVLPKASSLPKCDRNFPNLSTCATGG